MKAISDRKPTVALVLGSGGARGYAHVGVIEVLLERGFEIKAISGCSMGALVGGIHAAGRLRDFKDWATGLGQFDVFRLLDISLSSPGAIRGEKVFSFVRDLIGDVRIEDLPISYTAVATDLRHHKEIWFQEGPLHKAIRASVAIPSLITPVVYGDRVLVDGGLLNPLPIMPTIAAHADYIMAVNLSFYDKPSERLLFKEPAAKGRTLDSWMHGLRAKAAQLFDKDTASALNSSDNTPALVEGGGARAISADEIDNQAVSPETEEERAEEMRQLAIGKFDIMNLSFETMQSSLTQYKLAGYPPDLLINVPKGVCGTFDFHKAPELIQLGRQLATEALDRAFAEGRLQTPPAND